MIVLRFLVFPLSLAYGILTYVRNRLYDWSIFSSTSFTLPVISVGNLSAGGTGKTPHVEYLVRLLKDNYHVATLSRGYGRRSTGFFIVGGTADVISAGDEPLQFKRKFPGVTVAVDEDRVNGILQLKTTLPELEVVLLDDAFQHRRVKPRLSVLVTDYQHPFYKDHPFPSGRLREFRSGYKRADIVIVSKCPAELSQEKKKEIMSAMAPLPHQRVYFSQISYGQFASLSGRADVFHPEKAAILLVTGIADPLPLENYLRYKAEKVVSLRFPDHHGFSVRDIREVIKKFNALPGANKAVVVTEKDAVRLEAFREELREIPVYSVAIQIVFQGSDGAAFDRQVTDALK